MVNEKTQQQLAEALEESIAKVKEMGYTPIYAANYGSHNYNLHINLDEYQSDIDTKVIILPTLEELVNNSTPVSTTIDISTGQCDIKDIRAFIPTLMKANIQFLEILAAQVFWINPDFEKEIIWMTAHLDDLVQESKNELLKSIRGMCFEKQKALCHPYPTIKWKIDKWGYDGKQLHHIFRLYDFIQAYFYNNLTFRYSLWYDSDSQQRKKLMAAKLNKYTLEEAQCLAEGYNKLIKEETEKLMNEVPPMTNYREQYQQKAKQMIINNIKKRIKEDK